MIRLAKEEDAQQISDILNPLMRNTLYSYSNQEYDASLIKRILLAKTVKGHPYFVFDVQGEVAGISTYYDFNISLPGISNENDVEFAVAVSQKYQNTGIAYALNDAVINYAKDKKVNSVWGCSISGNEDGYKFIIKAGYKYVTTLPNFKEKFGVYRDLIMFKRLL